MVEAIQCPSCQTRYGLKPARVRTGLRRAQCFRCGDVFHIELEVKRLLATLEPEPAPLAPSITANVPLATLAEAIHHTPEPAAASLEAGDLALPDLDLPEPPEPPAAWPSPAETAPIPSMALQIPEPPALQVHEPAPVHEPIAPAVPPTADLPVFDLPPLPEPAAASAEETAPDAGGTYASAKDAIARLFGDAPLAPSPAAALRGALSQGHGDPEASMKALEDTLGGVRPEALSTRPFAAAPESTPAPAAIPMQEIDLPHATSTVRMTAAEMMAAVEPPAMPELPDLPELPSLPQAPEITQEEVTMVLPPPAAASPAAASADPSALRLRIGDQVYTGLDIATIAKWIEEGRVVEDHQVTRGASENWMDAAKVPALRAVFDRMRRGRGGIELTPPPSGIGDSGAKRGLFGGMFGKKD